MYRGRMGDDQPRPRSPHARLEQCRCAWFPDLV